MRKHFPDVELPTCFPAKEVLKMCQKTRLQPQGRKFANLLWHTFVSTGKQVCNFCDSNFNLDSSKHLRTNHFTLIINLLNSKDCSRIKHFAMYILQEKIFENFGVSTFTEWEDLRRFQLPTYLLNKLWKYLNYLE